LLAEETTAIYDLAQNDDDKRCWNWTYTENRKRSKRTCVKPDNISTNLPNLNISKTLLIWKFTNSNSAEVHLDFTRERVDLFERTMHTCCGAQ